MHISILIGTSKYIEITESKLKELSTNEISNISLGVQMSADAN